MLPFIRTIHAGSFRMLMLALAGALSLATVQRTLAQCGSALDDGDFEQQRRLTVSNPWIPEGTTGIDLRRELSRSGWNNAWSRNVTGWNAIRQRVHLSAGVLYTLTGFVRTSANVRDGYFGFRDARQHPVSEIKFGPLPGYRELRVQFRPAQTGDYFVFTGFWAPNADGWIRMDRYNLYSPCEDVHLVPYDG
jgi:hypothetical protein